MKRNYTPRVIAWMALWGLTVTPLFVGCQPPPRARPTAPSSSSTSTETAEEKELAKDIAEEIKDADAPAVPAPEVKPSDNAKPVEEPKEKPLESDPAQKPVDPQLDDKKPADAVDQPTDAAVEEGAKLADQKFPTIPYKPDTKANAPIKPGDWSQFGGTSYRNNTPIAKNVPIDWKPGKFDRRTGVWKKELSKNIKWVARLGSQTFGNPVISGGHALVGTNNEGGWLKHYPAEFDLGVMLCFDEKTGEFQWQYSCEKLPTGRANDWPYLGICAAPYVEGERAWVVTSRGEVVCVDTKGFHDGEDDGEKAGLGKIVLMEDNDDEEQALMETWIAALDEGKMDDELRKRFAAGGAELPAELTINVDEKGKKWSFTAMVAGAERKISIAQQGPRIVAFKPILTIDKEEADVVWTFDMMKEFGSQQHNMCSTSITAWGDILFVCTGNGVDESHVNIPAPQAASFFAIDKNTKEVYWSDNSPGENIIHGQWGSPAVAELGGVPQVIFGGGDGWLYSFKADKGKDGKPEFLWKFDLNPKEAKWVLGGRGTRNEPIGMPAIYNGLVYVAVGQDPEHLEGPGHMYCIDPTKRGDVSEYLVVKREDPTKVVPPRRLVGVLPEEGEVVIPNKNTACVWHYAAVGEAFEEVMHRTIGTAAIQDDLVFIADFSGLFHCFDAKTGKEHWNYDMLAASWSSPLIVDGHVYIGDEDGDIAIFKASKDQKLPVEPIAEINMGNAVYSTPIVANGVLYIANKKTLFAIQNLDGEVAKKGGIGSIPVARPFWAVPKKHGPEGPCYRDHSDSP